MADELSRLVRRWQQLPVDQASARMPRVLTGAAGLAALSGAETDPPDLGPGVAMDQLVVTAYDACAAGRAADALAVLTALRRDLWIT